MYYLTVGSSSEGEFQLQISCWEHLNIPRLLAVGSMTLNSNDVCS